MAANDLGSPGRSEENVVKGADPDFSTLPDAIKARIVSELNLFDRLSLALTSRSFYDAVFDSDVGCRLRVLYTNEGSSLDIAATPSKWTKVDIDPLLSYWNWTTKLDSTLPKGVSDSVGKLATKVTFAVDDKVQDVDETSDVARWLASMDTPGLTSLFLRPCNIGRVSPPRAFVLKLCDLISLNAQSLRELHFITWPLKSGGDVPPIHAILDNHPQLKEHLRCFSYLWQGNDLRSWQPANVPFPGDDVSIPLISSMRHLQQLNIASQILTAGFLASLSSDSNAGKLKCLRVCFSDVVHQVGDGSWRLFSSRHFGCRVEFSLLKDKIRAGNCLWKRAFHSDLPLAKISFMKHALCEDSELVALSEAYGKSLDTFTMKSLNGGASSGALLEFVEKCSVMRNLVYFGVVDFAVVEKLIAARGSSWNFLAFVAEQVNLADPRAEDQDEFFFERRKLLMQAELQQEIVLNDLVEKSRDVISGQLQFVPLKEADWNVEHIEVYKKEKLP